MSHPLVVALFSDLSQAAAAAGELHAAGVGRDQLSVISRNHDEESNYAAEIGGSPGAEIEDSRTAARFGELSGYFLAAMALVLPGIGPIVAAGPLAAGLGEAAGHVAGGIAAALRGAGIPADRADAFQVAVEGGAILLAVHTVQPRLDGVREILLAKGATAIATADWAE
jgi:homoserine kinase